MLNLEYRLFTTNNSGAWISASGEVSDGFQKLEFEATHNEYQDIDVSSSNSFEITGNFLNFVKEWLLFDANKSTNSIECRIYYEDVDCNGYFNHYAYIRSNDIQPFNVKVQHGFDNKRVLGGQNEVRAVEKKATIDQHDRHGQAAKSEPCERSR
jgi:hypothetical protein